MAEENVHELTAGYALDALEADQERLYEAHLRRCDACRRELASLYDAAGALAYAVEGPPPPPELRERIVAAARAERSNVRPFRSRVPVLALSGLAAAAAAIAVGVGIWAASLSSTLQGEREAQAQRARGVEVLADEDARRIALLGAEGTLVVAPTREAVLVLDDFARAPAGKTYEAWVLEDGAPRPAGTFEGGEGVTVHRLSRRVPSGARVMVTVEPEGGVDAPTGFPIVRARTT